LIVDGAGVVVVTGAIDLHVCTHAIDRVTNANGIVALGVCWWIVTKFVGPGHTCTSVTLIVEGAQIAVFAPPSFRKIIAVTSGWIAIAQRFLALGVGRVVADFEGTRCTNTVVTLIVEAAKITIFTVAENRRVTASASGRIAIAQRFLALGVGRVVAGL
tara:strand:+ start:1420 stop:1896 length:477 start_codon:yes stop_codon:yes gene_type:complete